MKNNGGPAFPQHGWTSDLEILEKMKQAGTGMSLRDYFAAQAPQYIPDWFDGQKNEITVLPNPLFQIDDLVLRRKAEEWTDAVLSREAVINEPPNGLEYFKELWGEYRSSLNRWNERNEQLIIERYMAWRWFYADAMIAEREK